MGALFQTSLGVLNIVGGVFVIALGLAVWVQRSAGLLPVGLGVLMMTGRITWLTEVLGRIWSYRPPVGM